MTHLSYLPPMEDNRIEFDNYQRITSRLRALRIKNGLTLRDVEKLSGGVWKAIVIGSYERGVRKISLEKAARLCQFYGAEISALGQGARTCSAPGKLIIDLRALRMAIGQPDEFSRHLYSLVRWVIAERDDWNGHVLSLRDSDLHQLEISTQKPRDEIIAALQLRCLILKAPNRL